MQAGKSLNALTKALEILTRPLPPRTKPTPPGGREGPSAQPTGEAAAPGAADRPETQDEPTAIETGIQPRQSDQVHGTQHHPLVSLHWMHVRVFGPVQAVAETSTLRLL